MVNLITFTQDITVDIFRGLVTQAKKNLKFLSVLYIMPILFLSTLYIVGQYNDIPISNFLKDPVSVTHSPFYTGMVSNFGVLFWFASAIICFFTSYLLRKFANQTNHGRFFLYFGCLSLFLMLDDLLLIHEQVFPVHLGTSEKLIYISYIILLGIGLIQFYPVIIKTKFLFLLLGASFLGLSIVVDFFQERIEDKLGGIRILLEDGFKFMGILGWFSYFANSSLEAIRNFVKNEQATSHKPVD